MQPIATLKTTSRYGQLIPVNPHVIDRKIRREQIKAAKRRGDRRPITQQLVRLAEELQDFFDRLAFGEEEENPFYEPDPSPAQRLPEGWTLVSNSLTEDEQIEREAREFSEQQQFERSQRWAEMDRRCA